MVDTNCRILIIKKSILVVLLLLIALSCAYSQTKYGPSDPQVNLFFKEFNSKLHTVNTFVTFQLGAAYNTGLIKRDNVIISIISSFSSLEKDINYQLLARDVNLLANADIFSNLTFKLRTHLMDKDCESQDELDVYMEVLNLYEILADPLAEISKRAGK